MRSLDDTIAAIATPPGEGGIAVVRVSGPGASGVARAAIRDAAGASVDLQARTVRLARAVNPDSEQVLDEVLVLWMPGPASYTRQDVLEIQCHGGQSAARSVLDAIVSAGARLADPGEFTLRAFVSGRIDLVQAEAVLDVIQARTEESLRIHEGLLGGRLSRDVEDWQEDLGRTLIFLEAHLDFSEEDVGELDPDGLLSGIDSVMDSMSQKLETFAWGRTSRDGFSAALVGSPNVGKSSLLNALLQEDRAIVSPVPGTTRDVIEAWVNASGLPVRLIDTAGLRAVSDGVEEEGVRRARRAAGQADLVVFVCDGSRDLDREELQESRRLAEQNGALPVINKTDLGAMPAGNLEAIFRQPPLRVSALTGEGIPDLLQAFRGAAWKGAGPSPEVPLTRARHRACVQAALESLRRARHVLATGGFLELAASEIHGARRHLAALLGWGTPEDVLDRIFSEFCIGK